MEEYVWGSDFSTPASEMHVNTGPDMICPVSWAGLDCVERAVSCDRGGGNFRQLGVARS
jgi:hypothetical protein